MMHAHLASRFEILKDNLLAIDKDDEKCLMVLKRMEIDVNILKAQIEIKIKRAEQKYRSEHDNPKTAKDIFLTMKGHK